MPKIAARTIRTGLGVVLAPACLALATAAAADDPNAPVATAPVSGPPLVLTPSVGVEEDFTSNVYLTPGGGQFDAITQLTVQLDAKVNSGRLTGNVQNQLFYDQYAQATSLSGWSDLAFGRASYAIVPKVLSIDADGTLTDGFVSTFGESTVDRTGLPGRIQLATYDIGPHLTTTVAGALDVDAAVRFDQVFFFAGDNSIVGNLPTDTNIIQVVGRADTGARMGRLELLTTGEFDHDNGGFESGSGAQSFYWALTPTIRMIARAGYDTVNQPGVVNISAPMATGGVEWRPNASSRITVEAGERYDRAILGANAVIAIASRIYVTGDYEETIQPDQLYFTDSFAAFLQNSSTLPPPLVPATFTLNELNLYNETSFNKRADAQVVLQAPRQTLSLGFNWINRVFLPSQALDREVTAMGSYTRQLRRHLAASLQLSYDRTYESPLYGPAKSYTVTFKTVYQATRTLQATFGYSYERQTAAFVGPQAIDEHVLYLALTKTL